MKYLNQFYQLVVVGKQKAIAAFVIAAVGTFVAKHGWTLDHTTLTNVVSAAVYGVIAHLGVYFTTNGK